MRSAHGLRRKAVLGLMVWLAVCAGVAAALLPGAVWPEASGDRRSSDGDLTVDASHSEDGYFMAKAAQGSRKLKLRVEKDGTTLTYDLNSDGAYEVFPLQLGSGSYACKLYENLSGNKYAQVGAVTVKAELTDEYAAFLCPNQYVNYTPDSAAVALSEEICQGLESDREKFDAIREYIRRNYVYDFVRAATVVNASGTLPDIDGCVERRMGICQDLAGMAACMLRVQGIPTKLVVGYADNSYHAWNSVRIDGEEVLYDPTADLNALPGSPTYTVERFY